MSSRLIIMKWVTLGIFLGFGTFASDAANILAILPTPAFSHQQFYRTYIKELHKRGHNITFVSPNPFKDPSMKNFREIDLSYGYTFMKENFDVSSESGKQSLVFTELFLIVYWMVVKGLCHVYLSDPNLKDLYKSREKYDLFIMEWGILGCIYPFGRLSNYKMIGVSSFEVGTMSQPNLGNPVNPAYMPDVSLEYSDRMTFLQRLRSTVYEGILMVYLVALRWHETNIARHYLGNDVPYLYLMESGVSLVMDNSHFSMSYPKPVGVNFISLGGPPFHLNGVKPKQLPKNIKDFVDSADHGVIYFSLGTNVKTSNISSREETIIMETFGKLKQKVLWKWENDDLKVDLKNVMKSKWFPQVDILAHPKTKAFVTQAGLQSIGEAIQYHVPMIVIPFFADQNHNARKLESVGAAIHMDFDSITVDSFTKSLNEIVCNKTYKENIKRFSELVNDQPIPPLEKAVWWTEYVIRHNGAFHLRSPGRFMNWFEYSNVDVFLLVYSTIIIVCYLSFISTKKLFNVLLNILRSENKKKKNKKE